MTEDDYVQNRLEDQIDWYSRKSEWNQSRFKWLRLIEIYSATLIPFLSAMGERIPFGAWIIGTLGVLIALAAATGSLFKFHENWIQYRTTAEQLKREKFLFLTSTHPYDDKDKFAELVQRVEGLISKENTTWTQVSKKSTRSTNGASQLDTQSQGHEAT